MKLEILLSCMRETDDALIRSSGITGDAVMINQTDSDAYFEYKTENGTLRMFSVRERGLTKSRNLAIEKSKGDICLLCDDDEIFQKDYQSKILSAYKSLPDADVIIFKMVNRPPSFPDKIQRLKFPQIMKVSSWQISFRRASLLSSGVRFDEKLGAGTGNGGEEELKFLSDCLKAKLKIYYVPKEIASVAQESSTWFHGFDEQFFENRGATTRYILGVFPASVYALYYVVKKRKMYASDISPKKALAAIFRGIRENKIKRDSLK